MEHRCGQYSVTNCWCDVGLSVRCFRLRSLKIDVPTFKDRCYVSTFQRSMCRPSKIDDRYVDLQRSTIDMSTFEDQCFDFGRSMYRLSKIDVSTFGDRCVNLRRSMIDLSTFEDRWSKCRSTFDDRCEIMLLAQNIDTTI